MDVWASGVLAETRAALRARWTNPPTGFAGGWTNSQPRFARGWTNDEGDGSGVPIRPPRRIMCP